MKKTILLLMISISCMSQIQVSSSQKSYTVGKVNRAMQRWLELEYSIYNTDTVYALTYRNELYSQLVDYKTIAFAGKNNAFNDLYTAFKSCFLSENKDIKDYSLDVTLGKEKITITRYKALGSFYIKLISEGGYVTFGENQLNKLFGKK